MELGQVRRIQIITEMIRRSELMLHENTTATNGLALSLLHDAIEHSLYLVLLTEHVAFQKREEFKDLVFRANEIFHQKTKSDLPYQRQLHSLNRARVEFKHHGNSPDRNTTLEIWENGRQFVEVLVRELFALSLENFHPVAAIRSTIIQASLEQALSLCEEGKFQDAMCKAADANWFLDAAFGAAFEEVRPPLGLTNSNGIPGLDRVIKRVMEYVSASDRKTLMAAVMVASGLDVLEHAKLRRRLPGVQKSFAGNPFYDIKSSKPFTESDVSKSVDQITRVTLWIEERFPNLKYVNDVWLLEELTAPTS